MYGVVGRLRDIQLKKVDKRVTIFLFDVEILKVDQCSSSNRSFLATDYY